MEKCCGNSLQTGVTLIAVILNIIPAVFFLIHSAFEFYILGQIDQSLKDEGFYQGTPSKKASAFLLGITGIVMLAFGIILLRGAQQKNISKCRIWLVWAYIAVSLFIVGSIRSLFALGTFSGSNKEEIQAILMFFVPVVLAFIFVKFYAIWVVHRFKSELGANVTNESRAVGPYLKMTA